ncbi:hypothetical protein PSCICN_18870 [Pseudomonas cichorii]|nr:hypothetical protein PSCICN_18870 [Pseudomonas cichorii]
MGIAFSRSQSVWIDQIDHSRQLIETCEGLDCQLFRQQEDAANAEALMSLEMTIVMLIMAWLMVAGAMLWGVLRISRRHHPRPVRPAPVVRLEKRQPATAH